MKNSIRFEDNSSDVKQSMDRAIISWLHESAGEVESEVRRKSRVDTGQTKGGWTYGVDEVSKEACVGSDKENAIWEEFGTGEYALEGNGRKGKWYVHESKLTPQAKSKMKKVYGKNGKVYYETRGKRPQRTLYNAFKSKESAIQKRAQEIMKGLSK